MMIRKLLLAAYCEIIKQSPAAYFERPKKEDLRLTILLSADSKP